MPRASSGVRMRPASMVLPKPTSSATSQREGQRCQYATANPELVRQEFYPRA